MGTKKDSKKSKSSKSPDLSNSLQAEKDPETPGLSTPQSGGGGSNANGRTNSQSTSVNNSSDNAARELALELLLKNKFQEGKDLDIQSFLTSFASSHKDESISDLPSSNLAEALFSYCVAYDAYSSAHNLMKPATVYGYLWDALSTIDRDELKDAVQDHFLSLDTPNRTLYKDVQTESITLAPNGSISDEINRCKLYQLNAKEIPMNGTKLDRNTTPLELVNFLDSVERCSLQRTLWPRLLQLKVKDKSKSSSGKKKKTLSILHDFRKITEKMVMSYDFHHTQVRKAASLAMYDAISATMSNKFRAETRLWRDQIDYQGPRLLWYVLNRLSQQDSRVVANFHQEVPTFQDAFKSTNYNVHLVCPVLYDRLLNYRDAGGDPQTHYSVLSTALISMHCDALTSTVREWEQRQMRDYDRKCIIDLVQQIPIFVDRLIQDGNWPYKKLENTTFSWHLPKKAQKANKPKEDKPASAQNTSGSSKSKEDLTAFVGKANKLLDKMSDKMDKVASNSNHQANTAAVPPVHRTDYRFCADRWGPNKYFKDKESFEQFFQGTLPGLDKSQAYKVDNVIWKWCKHCSRMGSHDSDGHRDKRKSTSSSTSTSGKKAKFTTLPPTVANTATLGNSTVDNSSSFDADEHLSEIETQLNNASYDSE